ncbi:MAG: twin transmembrane helix small protein [Sneathiella sp.]|nr:twin transmembrane helix small protein [Sneathiella sp.]
MFNYLIIAALAATVVVVVIGIVTMAKGGDFNRKYGNKLMRLRLVMQAVVVILILAGFWFEASGGL